ncbi:MAG: FHA domain-containing protein [Armatimonadetes bacterium]|nr:FHA domain-containing protein [Armatimonadota bacterium]
MRAITAFLLGLLAVVSFADSTFKVTMPRDGAFEIWVSDSINHYAKPKSTLSDTKELEFTTAENPSTSTVYAHDPQTGRVAESSLADIMKTKDWAPKADAFKRVYSVTIAVKNAKGPVNNVNLIVAIGATTNSRNLLDKENAEITLYNLPNPDLKISLSYDNDTKQTDTELHSVPADGPSHKIEISAPDFIEPVASVGTTATEGDAPKADSKEKDEPKTTRSPLAVLFNYLIGFGLVGGIGYGIYWYYKNNTTKVEAALKQAGIQASNPPDPTGAMPVEPQNKPLEKIQLGGVTPTPSDAGAAVAAVTPITANPRLVGSDGTAVNLSEGELTVGRENAGLTITGESSVSRLHAKLTRSGDSVTVSDEGSTNGTYVNGIEIASPTVLQSGDQVQFGAIQYRYET